MSEGKKLHQEKKRKPKFWIDFVGFVDYGLIVEANLAVSPEYYITSVVSTHIHSDGSRVISLKFRRKKQNLGRRGYSLKQEWEQLTVPLKSE